MNERKGRERERGWGGREREASSGIVKHHRTFGESRSMIRKKDGCV